MKKPLSKALRTFYGVGDFGFSMMASVETFLFVFFLTNVAKFSLPMVAVIGTITSVVDAVLSPFYGAIITGAKAMKWGRTRSWILIAPPFVVVLFMFQFSKIGPEPMAAAIVCAGFILSHIMWNLGWVANLSLITVLANTPEDRGLLASRRATYTALAGVFFSYIGSPLAVLLGTMTGHPALGYSLCAFFMGLLMLAGYMIIFKITDGYEETGAEAAAAAANAPKHEKVSGGDMLKMVFQNRPLLILLIGDFFRYIESFINSSSAAYYFTYVAQNMALLPLYLLLSSITMVIGSYFAASIAKKFSNRTASIISLWGIAVFFILCKFVGFNIVWFFVFIMVTRLFTGITNSTMVALYSDVAVYNEWKTGKNASSFIMGLMTLSLKIAIISRGTIIPFVLAAAGFVAGADPKTASMALKDAVINVFVFIPGIFTVVSAIIINFGFRLTREKVTAYQAEIDKRKAHAV